jgi:phosphohistidine phosphatase
MSITEVYFIRHGIAAVHDERLEDEVRSLTQKGIAKTQRIAQRLSDLDLQFDALLSSPLVRARQTSEILKAAGLASQIQEFLPLKPGGSLLDWLTWLGQWQFSHSNISAADTADTADTALWENSVHTSVALVGHEPDLSLWAQQLVCGHLPISKQSNWVLKKAGIIGLQVPAAKRAIGQSQLFWLSPPRFLL